VNSTAQQRLLGVTCIAFGLIALGFGGLALWIGGGAVLAFGLLVAGLA
jgi:hypothetical protein